MHILFIVYFIVYAFGAITFGGIEFGVTAFGEVAFVVMNLAKWYLA